MLLGRAEDTEALARLVVDLLPVLGADAAVLRVVVARPFHPLDVVDEAVGQRRRVVLRDHIEDMVRDHGREPADLLARVRHVVGDVRGRAGHDLDRGWVPACLRGSRSHLADDPLDDLRIGELDDDPVGDAAGHREHTRPVAGDVDGDLRLSLRPLEVDVGVVPAHGLAVCELLDHRRRALELVDLDRLLPDRPARRVAAPDADHHPPAGDRLEGGERAGRHRRLACPRVRDVEPEPERRRLERGHRQQRVRVVPEDVRVVRPAVFEAVLLGE